MSPHIWATRTTTLSYTQLSLVQVRTSLLAFPRFIIVATLQSNLDSALAVYKCCLLRKRQDCVFRCDYVSTSSPRTGIRQRNSASRSEPLTGTSKYPSKPATAILRLGRTLSTMELALHWVANKSFFVNIQSKSGAPREGVYITPIQGTKIILLLYH